MGASNLATKTVLLAIDPGADLGWAVYVNGQLTSCGVGDPKMASAPNRVVLERPAIYPGARQQARPRDVITLALRAGEAAGVYARAFGVVPEYFEPRVWKGGSLTKEAHHPRIWKRLFSAEQHTVSSAALSIAQGKQHNMMDAIGIGLFA